MRCKACQYSLEHLTERRCPECGCQFDPNDPDTFDTPLEKRKRFWVRLWYVGLVVLMAVLWLLMILPELHR
jgi:hypothetical protein